jgi:hypothetical protein
MLQAGTVPRVTPPLLQTALRPYGRSMRAHSQHQLALPKTHHSAHCLYSVDRLHVDMMVAKPQQQQLARSTS